MDQAFIEAELQQLRVMERHSEEVILELAQKLELAEVKQHTLESRIRDLEGVVDSLRCQLRMRR